MSPFVWILLGIVAFLVIVAIRDLVQTQHAILRNFPVLGHLRYMLESIGPELRQYIVAKNNEERPFSRDQRRWVYSSSKLQNNYFGFGTDNDLDTSPNYLLIKHAAFPFQPPVTRDPNHPIPCAKVLGAARGRAKAFRPESIVNISAMSFGSLSSRAVEALNAGCALAGSLQNTGEGGISSYHDNGAGLIWQIGTGYFGCRNPTGGFSLDRLLETIDRHDVRALEIKLSQGAKPGHGGILPAAKVTPQIARIRGIPVGEDCLSPPGHSAFHDVDSMLDFVEKIAEATGLPVGIKSAIGESAFWIELAEQMADGTRGVDHIQIDGGEGGTGAAPLVFSDHVSLPFKIGMSRVYRIFAERELTDRIVFIGSGKLGFPESALLAFGLGCDLIAIAREAMLAIGCIQAQRCQTGHCPTGVATQSAWLMRGLDPTHKAARLANYLRTLRLDISELSRACGLPHPALVTLEQMEILDDICGARDPHEIFDYQSGWGLPSRTDQEAARRLMAAGGKA